MQNIRARKHTPNTDMICILIVSPFEVSQSEYVICQLILFLPGYE